MSMSFFEWNKGPYAQHFTHKVTAINVSGENVFKTGEGWEITMVSHLPGDRYDITIERSRKDEDEQEEKEEREASAEGRPGVLRGKWRELWRQRGNGHLPEEDQTQKERSAEDGGDAEGVLK